MFNGQHPNATFDTRNAFIEKDVYAYLADNESVLTDQVPVEDVGIFFSKATRDALGRDGEAEDGYGVFIKGVESVLVDAHIQYNFIPDLDFSLEKIRHLKLLLIPNGALMSDEQIEVVRQYVSQGGALIASYETSLYDELGRRRADFGLKEVFGVSSTGIRKDTSSDCYQRVMAADHPVLGSMGMERSSLIINGGSTHLCTLLGKAGYTPVCNYIPFIFNQPPEKAWIADMETQFPTIVAGNYGAGRVVYFANQTDKLCHTNGHEDFVNSYRNAIAWAMRAQPSVCTDAPDSVHVALTEKVDDPTARVLSFVNMTAAPRRPIKALQKVGGFHADVRLPGSALGEYGVLRQDGPIDITVLETGDGEVRVRVAVESLQEFAAVYLKTE
jgi:hypothetical protein